MAQIRSINRLALPNAGPATRRTADAERRTNPETDLTTAVRIRPIRSMAGRSARTTGRIAVKNQPYTTTRPALIRIRSSRVFCQPARMARTTGAANRPNKASRAANGSSFSMNPHNRKKPERTKSQPRTNGASTTATTLSVLVASRLFKSAMSDGLNVWYAPKVPGRVCTADAPY